jgi:hypothetical protein
MNTSATNRKISWFRREDSLETLDLSPGFQRRPIWTDEQASYLIDTVLSGLPFPEIYVRSISAPSGDTRHEVVDGQQRIRSILRFGSNDLDLSGDDVSPKWVGKSFEDLSDSQKTTFWDYEIVVRDVGSASDLEVRDLFRRLNLNSMTLNEQELRHATYKGHFIKLMESLADDEWWTDMRLVNPRQVRRMEDVEYISELFLGLIAGPQDKKKTLDDYYQDYEANMPEASAWTARFKKTRDVLAFVLPEQDIRAWSGKSDFYSLFLAFGMFSDRDFRLDRKREAVRHDLMEFRKKVDQAKRKDNTRRFAQDVHEYADAVTRAATDVGRRELRIQVLFKIVKAALAR